jgi:hypothetical protein
MEGLIWASICKSSLILKNMRDPFLTKTSIRSMDKMLINIAENAIKYKSFLLNAS